MALGNELESTAIYDWNMQSNVNMATKLFKLSYFMLQRIRLSPGWSYSWWGEEEQPLNHLITRNGQVSLSDEINYEIRDQRKNILKD